MLAEKPWRIEAVMRLVLGLVVTFCAAMFLAGVVEHFASGWAKARSDLWQIVVATIGLEIPALAWIAWFLRQHRIGWKDAFGLRMSGPLAAVARGVLAGALFLPAAWLLQWGTKNAMEWMRLEPQAQSLVRELQDPSLSTADKVAFGVIAIALAPIVEEALFRGILYPVIKQRGWPRLALWGTSVLFAALHFNEASFLPLLLLALVLVYLYESFENLLVPVTAHAFFNAANFFVVIFNDPITRRLHLA
jgi:membrane protease YdiL (CAAX protease family)